MSEATPEGYVDVSICAVLSTPMVGWQPHMGCAYQALRPYPIEFNLAYGAFWGHSMQNLLEGCIERGVDWALTLDYDSLFTETHFKTLMHRLAASPEIDALAALQCRRGTEESPLMSLGAGVKEVEVTGQPIKVNTAHFGLTLIRLDRLKDIPKPWFLGTPDPDGRWSTADRTDDDIYFWRKWQEHGRTVAVDTNVRIGHLQPMVAEFDEHFNARHVHVCDWRKREQCA